MSADRNGHRIFEQSGVVLTFPHGMEFDGLVAALDTIRRQVGRDEEYVNQRATEKMEGIGKGD